MHQTKTNVLQTNNRSSSGEWWAHEDRRALSWLIVDIITLNMELRFVGNNVFVASNNPCVRYYLSMKRKDSERLIIWLCRISSWRADSSSQWCTLATLIRLYLHKLSILIKLWSINRVFSQPLCFFKPGACYAIFFPSFMTVLCHMRWYNSDEVIVCDINVFKYEYKKSFRTLLSRIKCWRSSNSGFKRGFKTFWNVVRFIIL